MTFTHVADLADDAVLRADVCIVGGGAAGIAAACRLDGSRLDVLLLEAGGLEPDPELEDEAFEIEHVGIPYGDPLASRGRYFGGSTNLWWGRMATLDPIDLEQRPWVPHSGWPITHADIQAWIPVAAELLGVPNLGRTDPATWSDHPAVAALVDQGGLDVGVFVWAEALFMGRHHRPVLESSRNVRVVLGATATELVPNEGSTTIDALRTRGADGRTLVVEAAAYVLAAGGLENPRLLLSSTGRSEHGVGNAHDLVGRHYMDHPRVNGAATIDLRGLDDAQVANLAMLAEHTGSGYGTVQLRLRFRPDEQRRHELLNHAVHGDLASAVHSHPGYAAVRRFAGRIRPRTTYDRARPTDARLSADLWSMATGAPALTAHAVRQLLGRARPETLFLHDQMEQEPDPDSRVTLDWSRRDPWGLPKLRLDWRVGESTFRSQQTMHRSVRDALHRLGIESFHSRVLDDPDGRPQVVDMKHPSGTTRMSADPRHGVVDGDLRVHGVANLYVTGSSTFPTVGHANPTLTIVALTARLADHLKGRFATPGWRPGR